MRGHADGYRTAAILQGEGAHDVMGGDAALDAYWLRSSIHTHENIFPFLIFHLLLLSHIHNKNTVFVFVEHNTCWGNGSLCSSSI